MPVANHSQFLWCFYFIDFRYSLPSRQYHKLWFTISQYHNITILRYHNIITSQYHKLWLWMWFTTVPCRQPTPNVFQPDARHFDSSTFCALLGGRSRTRSWKPRRDEGRGRSRRGHYYSRELPAFVSQNKNQLRAFLRSVSTHDWLLAKLIHTFVLLLMNVCSVVMTTLAVNDFTFKNVAMQLCNFPNQYPIYIVASKSHT